MLNRLALPQRRQPVHGSAIRCGGVNVAASKGGTADAPEFHDRESFEDWLEDRPRKWGAVLARRAALRAGVICLQTSEHSNVLKARLHALRALFILYSASAGKARAAYAYADAYPANTAGAFKAARGAGHPAKGAGYAAVFAAYAAAADAYGDAADAAANTATAVNAVAAVGHTLAAVGDEQSVWIAVQQDAQALTQGYDPGALAATPLWPAGRPSWVDEHFHTVAQSRTTWTPWAFWAAWYRCVLLGEPTGSVIDPRVAEEIALQDKSFLEDDEDDEPDAVMARIVKMAGWDPAANPVEPLPGSDQAVAVKDHVPAQSDRPATIDELGRDVFAQALEAQIREMQDERGADSQGFAANIDAPWGAGKSSVLNLLKARLTTHDQPEPRWIVAEFNAWQHEHRKPPWWPMIARVNRDVRTGLWRRDSWPRAIWLRLRWVGWRLLSDWLAYSLLGVLAFVFFLSLWLGWWSQLGGLIGFLAVIAPLIVVITGAVRGAVFGSPETARAFVSMRYNPLDKLRAIFRTIVKIADRPVCVFIDDLDRCSADYVVDLLEGIQTAFRGENVVYVVAADRQWIKAAFEARYKPDFAQVETVGQPLGYMFLGKIFQVSAPLPGVREEDRQRYWHARLGHEDRAQAGASGGADQETTGETGAAPKRTQEDGAAREPSKTAPGDVTGGGRVSEATIEAEFQRIQAELAGNPGDYEALMAIELNPDNPDATRIAKARYLNQSAAALAKAEHRLADLSPLIPFNPRAMKRMLNAYRLRYADGIMVDASLSPERLARWVILEQSYPALADLLAQHPDWIEPLMAEPALDDTAIKARDERVQPYMRLQPLRDLLTLAPDRSVLAADSPERLGVETVRLFTAGMR